MEGIEQALLDRTAENALQRIGVDAQLLAIQVDELLIAFYAVGFIIENDQLPVLDKNAVGDPLDHQRLVSRSRRQGVDSVGPQR